LKSSFSERAWASRLGGAPDGCRDPCAAAKPIPLVPPVIKATLFCGLDIIAFLNRWSQARARGAASVPLIPELPDVHRLLIGYCSVGKACA
jgi:hypothetical protein